MKKIIIVGGGGFTKCIINYIENDPNYNIVGYIDIKDNGDILGVNYLGDDSILKSLFDSGIEYASVGIGIRLNDSSLKRKITNNLLALGFKIPILIGKNVVIHKGAIIEEGVIIRDGAVIQSGVTLKAFSMVGDNVVIAHDTIIGSYVHVVMGSTIGRNCIIGEGAFIGYGSTILNEIEVAEGSLIGARSLVNKSCMQKGIYYGCPAKFKK